MSHTDPHEPKVECIQYDIRKTRWHRGGTKAKEYFRKWWMITCSKDGEESMAMTYTHIAIHGGSPNTPWTIMTLTDTICPGLGDRRLHNVNVCNVRMHLTLFIVDWTRRTSEQGQRFDRSTHSNSLHESRVKINGLWCAAQFRNSARIKLTNILV